MQTRSYILTLMAANQVGILSSVTQALAELGGDIEEVSQTVMRKFFTIILSARFPEHRSCEDIVRHIEQSCQQFGIEVSIKDPSKESLQGDPGEGDEKYFLTISGPDERGIIGQITARLQAEGIDVTDLYAVRNREDHSFAMVMELSMPARVNAVELQAQLETLGTESGLSAALQHENIFHATSDPRPVRIAIPHRVN